MANTTVYPFGTNGTLPDPTGIINDKYTGGTGQALSAEVGKSLNEDINTFDDVNLSSLDEITAFITNENLWSIGTYKCKFVAVNPGEKYVIRAKVDGYSSFAVLKSSEHVHETEPSFATGWSRTNVSNGAYREFSIPSDGHYIYVAIYAGVDVTPSQLTKITGPINQKEWDRAMLYSLPLDSYGPIRAWPSATGKWVTDNSDYPYYGIFIPCNPGQEFVVVGTTYIRYCFLTTDDHVKNTNVDYATGYSGNPTVILSTLATLTAPADAHYLYMVVSNDGQETYIGPRSVQTAAESIQQIVNATIEQTGGEASDIPEGLSKYSYVGKQIRFNEEHKVAYEVLENAITSIQCQGGACYGDYLFMFQETNSTCWVYNLAEKELVDSISIPIASRGFVTNCHCNTVNFGTEKYSSSDPFPLLYVSTGYASEGYTGAIVYRVIVTTSGNTTSYSLSLVQTLKMPAYGSQSWSWTEFVTGDEGFCFICYTGPMVFYKMKMPKLSDGDVTFDLDDAMEVYTFPKAPAWFNNSDRQGHIYKEGKIYVCSGIPTQGNPNYQKSLLYTLDLATCTYETIINLKEDLGLTNESETPFIWQNHLCLVFRYNANVYKFYFD